MRTQKCKPQRERTLVQLLGSPLVVVLALGTALAPVLVCMLWTRVRGPRPVRNAARVVMLAGAQLVAIALAAALINDYALFYKSWSELRSGSARLVGLGYQPAENHRVSTSASRSWAGRLDVSSYPGYADPTRWSSTGRLESVTIRGAVSGLHSTALVYLPPQYFQNAGAPRYFPAIEVFTGYPGVEQYLVTRLKYPDVLRRLIDRHQASPAILVMMRPSVTFPRDTECTDVPGGPQAETFFAVDVPTQIAATYRVLSSGWGAIGDSTGGYCAAKLAMLNPATFHAAAEMSGYFYALHDSTTGDLWNGSTVVRDLNDLSWRIRHLPPPAIDLLVGTSPDEHGPDGYGPAIRFTRLVAPPMRVSVMSVPRGGHNIATWAAELPTALTWLTTHLPQPGSSTTPQTTGQLDLGLATATPSRLEQ